jgi:hydroxymethylbilane synthase
VLTIGSRGSQLALWQAGYIKQRLETLGETCRIEIIKTAGDRMAAAPLAVSGTKGLFTKEIEEALLAGTIDLAVHSLKDLPTALPAGLKIAATPEREDARDALAGSTLAALASGARVGTSSLRRVAQLRAARPGLRVDAIRGNLDTRLRKLAEGQYDAVVLAAAGLRRLGWKDRIAEYLPVEIMCPAVGQGALAVETREDGYAADTCAALDHTATRAAVEAERALLSSLGGGCQLPIGAYARAAGGRLDITAMVASQDGARILRRASSGPAADAGRIGHALGAQLLEAGARELLEGS